MGSSPGMGCKCREVSPGKYLAEMGKWQIAEASSHCQEFASEQASGQDPLLEFAIFPLSMAHAY